VTTIRPEEPRDCASSSSPRSRARGEEHPALGLGPIAVDPLRQNEGIGTALMHEAIERASRYAEAFGEH
jgi:predicted N-acetyltransferase YhbS